LEGDAGVPSPPAKGGTSLDNLERRMSNLVSEDLTDSSPSKGGKKHFPPTPSSTTGAPVVAAATPKAGSIEISGVDEESFQQVVGEVKRMSEEFDDTKAKLRKMAAELHALRTQAPAAAPTGDPAPTAPSGPPDAAAAAYVPRAEAAAKAAEESAEMCQKLKEELEEVLKAVEVPSDVALDEALFEEKPVEGDIVDLDDDVRDEAAREYVKQQANMNARLTQLEDQLESASVVMPESQIFSSLKNVIKDVRRCLARSELLFQLPEIKMFVKRFQKAMEVNAILHEKWIGPGAGRRKPEPEEGAGLGSARGDDQMGMTRDSDFSRSAPDLHSAGRGGKRGGTGKSQPGKKKPFRTVVDWVRPHTPLKIDPMFKGGQPSPGDDRPPPHLPQIK